VGGTADFEGGIAGSVGGTVGFEEGIAGSAVEIVDFEEEIAGSVVANYPAAYFADFGFHVQFVALYPQEDFQQHLLALRVVDGLLRLKLHQKNAHLKHLGLQGLLHCGK